MPRLANNSLNMSAQAYGEVYVMRKYATLNIYSFSLAFNYVCEVSTGTNGFAVWTEN